MKTNKYNVVVVTHPLDNKRAIISAIYLLQVLLRLCNKIFLIDGLSFYKFNQVTSSPEIKNVIKKINKNYGTGKGRLMWNRIMYFILVQLKISYKLLKISNNIDIIIFHFGSRFYVLPVFLSKLLKKKTIVFSFGSATRLVEKTGGIVLSNIMGFLEKVSFIVCDKIVVESENIIEFAGLNRYRYKISRCYVSEYVDTNNFATNNSLSSRENLIGYIGRLSKEKGVDNFVKAIALVPKKRKDLYFFIGGNGPLQNEIMKFLEDNKLLDKAELTQWIPHSELPNFLNKFKLIVIPSYTEGIPRLLLEAMACSTPVLATPVGGVPDIIKDGETGFIMENNSPECIARNIIRALNYPNLEKVAENARNLVEKKFTYEKVMGRYKKILEEVYEEQ